MITYIRQHCGFEAHQNDVTTAKGSLTVAAASQAQFTPVAQHLRQTIGQVQPPSYC